MTGPTPTVTPAHTTAHSKGRGTLTLVLPRLPRRWRTPGDYHINLGSRVFLLDEEEARYEAFDLRNIEFTLTVDASQLPCGVNGPLYFVEMPLDGGVQASGGSNEAGADKVVDTNRKVTVVTQFLTSEKDERALREIRRMHIQDERVIQNSLGFEQYDSITDEFCAALKEVFGNGLPDDFGGLATIGEAFKRGMVLNMSIWDDFDRETSKGWMDGVFPADEDPPKPGVVRGP
ncbi:hypothetical protein VNI00_014502 [Paramarasmius palmivorus]|uniref:Glucanase n=1 Tax=Paramarasmius palmivorus TaxID=297713 RepID=A0AAW0BVJ3_9AGAR